MICAILRVRYRGGSDATTYDVETDASLLDKIKELKSNPQVTHITVFRCHRTINLTEQWIETPYAPTTEEAKPK